MKPWLLLESPDSLSVFDKYLEAAHQRVEGIMLRFGAGLDPLLLMPRIRNAGFGTAVFLHFRDMNRTALLSALRTARELELKTVFLGDPFPIREAVAIGATDGPRFLEYARGLFGDAFTFGACFRFSHPSDRQLFDRYVKAGLQIAAAPPEMLPTVPDSQVQKWVWLRAGCPTPRERFSQPVMVDCSHLQPSSPEEFLQTLNQSLDSLQ